MTLHSPPLYIEERYYGNYSALIWDTTSETERTS